MNDWKDVLRKLRLVDKHISAIPNLIAFDRGDLEEMLESLQMDCDNITEIVYGIVLEIENE